MMIYDHLRTRSFKNGEQTALTYKNEHISYGELESVSNRLAGLLIKSGLKPGSRVGLYMEKRPKAISAMHGVSKAGGIYVPLDTQSPASRVSKIIKSSKLSLILVDHQSQQSFQEIQKLNSYIKNIPWAWWSEKPIQPVYDKPPRFFYSDINAETDTSHQVIRSEDSAAHILFTSGSTGQPKGVVITHKNINSFISWATTHFDMKPGERVSCHSPLHFDLSTFDIYGAFASGSHLFLVPADINVNPKKLADFIMDNQLDQWFSVPSVLNYMARFRAIPPGGFPNLKRLIWCGEVFPVPALQYWMKNLPDTMFTNLYGPTEATIASSYYTVPDVPADDEEIPIGTACAGEKLLVLDENCKSVKKGEKGDLYIAGCGLSPGYWQDVEKTNSAFIWYTDEFGEQERIYKTGDLASFHENGLTYFHGRSDYQIKSRGYRIELGEIETALGHNNLLREYAVVPVKKEGFEGTAIGCAYVGKNGQDNGAIPPALKKILINKIPGYMIPHYWREFKKLPRNGNGKIDRKKLSLFFEQQL